MTPEILTRVLHGLLARSQGWNCVQVFEGHSHYVMQVSFNPKDTNTFASASLDRTIKVREAGLSLPRAPIVYPKQPLISDILCVRIDRLNACVGQVWSLGQPTPNFTLEGHEKGVNCVDYFNGTFWAWCRHAATAWLQGDGLQGLGVEARERMNTYGNESASCPYSGWDSTCVDDWSIMYFA